VRRAKNANSLNAYLFLGSIIALKREASCDKNIDKNNKKPKIQLNV
jgi:hypothetical protein